MRIFPAAVIAASLLILSCEFSSPVAVHTMPLPSIHPTLHAAPDPTVESGVYFLQSGSLLRRIVYIRQAGAATETHLDLRA